ncbi:cytochrome b [Burkholderia sp. BCC1993]|uniref:cytochrome b n=1 Tax=Burkholderia sp. BCC1993 TaxID=2817444 RepID=UPI002AB0ACD1|nr:cytochrome b [Burkholderia sp. BCC1993]
MTRPTHFNRLARLLHWTMAVLIVAMLFIGVAMVASLSLRPWLLDLHRPLGIAIGVLVLVRIANRLFGRSPALPADLPRWQIVAAYGSHLLLYVLMIGLPLIGWAMLSAGNFPVELYGNVTLPAIWPTSPIAYARLHLAHVWLAFALFATVVTHLCAALHHAWVRRDSVFSSMASGPVR